MINIQPKPQFKNYPLNEQDLKEVHQERGNIEKEIHDNNAEIRILNSKIAKSDYQHSYLHRLHERDVILNAKKRQLDDIISTQRYLEQQVAKNKQNQAKFKSSLANQYKAVMQEKKHKVQQQKRAKIQEERRMQQQNQYVMRQEIERKRQEMQIQKRQAHQQLAMKQYMKQKQKDQKIRQKEQYNHKTQILGSLQTQKQATYKQYYEQFLDGQNRLQNIYQQKAAVQQSNRKAQRDQFLRKDQQEYAIRQMRQQQERVIKITDERNSLRNYLQYQIQQKNRRKNQEKMNLQNFNSQFNIYQQQTQREFDSMEKARKRQQQRRYDEELKTQIHQRHEFKSSNSGQNMFGKHNPITNPISFNIGITNPYIIKEYENTKERYMGDNHLKLKNLAMVGSSSLNKH